MARYIKANHLVAEFLHVENDRNRVTDGNYLLWQADILAFGKLIDLPEILAQIGGLALMAHEAKEEQDGTVVRPLPVATDPRFIIEPEPEPEDGNDTETAEGTEADAESDSEAGENSNESNEDGEENNAPESDTEDAQGDNNGEAEQDTAESENPAESPENDENNEPANED